MENAGMSIPESLASHLVAWESTRTSKMVSHQPPFPWSIFRWGLAATSGAYHKFHVDQDGMATGVEVRKGRKYWVVASPKKAHGSADASWYCKREYDLGNLPTELYDFDGVLLKPGQRL